MSERMPFPTNVDVIKSLIEQHTGEMFVALPGTIQSYDPTTQRADVVVGVRNPYPDPEGSGELLREDFPVIPHVKVLWPRMGKWFMAMSVAPGDPVQLLCNTLTPEDWFVGDGSPVDVGDTRRQHVAHAVALIGMNVNGEALRHAPSTPIAGITIGSDDDAGTRISLYGDKSVTITQGDAVVVEIDTAGVVHVGGAAGQFVALADLVNQRLSDIRTAFNAHTHVETGGTTATPTTPMGALADVSATRAKAT